MEPAAPAPAPPRRSRPRNLLITALLVLIAFAAGFVPKHRETRRLRETLQATQLDLRLADIHRQLGVALAESVRNDLGRAAAASQAFFGGCSRVLADYTLQDEPRTRTALTAYTSYRDDVLRQMAAGDPTVRDRLASMYSTMDGVLQRRQ